jgi:hypothetical protein
MDQSLNLKDIISKYKEVSPFVIIKTDVQRRTVTYSKRALEAVNPSIHQVEYIGYNIDMHTAIPCSLMLRDGTTIMSAPFPNSQTPYVVDVVDGKKVLTDNGEIIEEVEYWYKPDYYDRFTSSGVPMWKIVGARPQRLDINPYQYCHFWDNGQGCKFCAISATYHKHKGEKPLKLKPQDIAETVGEAIKQPGRFANILLTGGSIIQGNEPFDDELNNYIEILQAIGTKFSTKKFPSQLIATAMTERQLARLYEETGLMTYTADIEVLNEEKFNWICPGKANWVGYQEWKRRLYGAVDIFGRGNVNTGLVGGVELAKPNGFKNEIDALKATLEEAEVLAEHGVNSVYCVWNTLPGTVFHNQVIPSLEYYVNLSVGLQLIREKYALPIDIDNYKRCGNHPDADLARVQ